MDGFTYHDIFATKGIEYLVIIAFLILLVPFWVLMNKKSQIKARIQQSIGALTAGILRIPQGIFYSKTHTWAFMEKSGAAKIGLDDFLLQVVGNVRISSLKTNGEHLKKGDLLAEIDQNGKRLKVLSPLSGEIISTNKLVLESPGLLNQDPYDRGWLYAIKPADWKAETASFLMAGAATNWLHKEIERLKDFLAVSLGKHSHEPSLMALQEGGELRRNVLAELDGDVWKDFEKTFLM
ncbi:MAG: glycine cleavage system protein H [Bacteroidales bacterium]|nr:glycine cleavage system protein H [Bacteroidales bacterium]